MQTGNMSTNEHAATAGRRRIKGKSRSFNDPHPPVVQAAEVPVPRRRMNRRASTGAGYSPALLSYNNNQDGDGGLGRSSYDSTSTRSDPDNGDPYGYGYGDASPSTGGNHEDSLFNRAMQRGSISKHESEQKLSQQLAQVSDYKDRSTDRDDNIQMLKERFSTNKKNANFKPVPRLGRRSSISSTASEKSGVSRASEMSLDWSVEVKNAAVQRKGSAESFDMSADTIPMANIVQPNNNQKHTAKTDQIVESLVWFSFHTPRAVLEDLITHELKVWKITKRSKEKREKARSKRAKKRGKKRDYKMSYMMRNDDDEDESDEDSNNSGEGSVSSLSEQADDPADLFDGNFSECMLREQGMANSSKTIKLPKSVKRECALLFIDMSGFTKLSTLLDVESLSKVINSYFDMIVSEVIQYGGDILKFAGDAFFAEWKVIEDEDDDGKGGSNPLADLNASLASINEFSCGEDTPKLSTCVLSAAKCAASIVEKFSDYQVMTATNTSEAMLNVHCGIGVGPLVGLHVGDFKEDQEEEGVELRREFLFLGSPIDQISVAADVAADGEVMMSPEAITALAFCCDMTPEQLYSSDPVCIASRDEVLFKVLPEFRSPSSPENNNVPAALQPYESLRMHCKALNHAALARLHLQMALYVHPVIRGDELALSAAILAGKISQPTEALESRHRAEAELRSVLTIFIKAVISTRVTGLQEVDEELFQTLCDVMHVTARELDRYSGHLRQFIVDDKGVVLIATFGLRGSTFPNMVSNNGLPAIFAIHRSLKSELGVENRVGATFGKAYCGVVGGVRRHEFAVMGAPVNLAARLMASKVNKGILVDEAVSGQADARYTFNSLPPVQAKGYDHPVPILEPIENSSLTKKKKWSSLPFIGRSLERETIRNVASAVLSNPEHASISMVFLMGESGMGKSALALSVVDEIKNNNTGDKEDGKTIICARSTSTETQQKIPLSTYRKVFQIIVKKNCEYDGTLSCFDDGRSLASNSTTGNSYQTSTPKTPASAGRFRALSHHNIGSGGGSVAESRPSLTKCKGVRGVLGSMRDISAGFASPGSVRQLLRRTEAMSGKKLIPTTNQSVHGGGIIPSIRPGKRDLAQSLHRFPPTPNQTPKESLNQSLNCISTASPKRASRLKISRDETSCASGSVASGYTNKHTGSVPFFEKLCWACEELGYPYEFADIVGSQFLGLDGASPVTHVEGHIPTMDELSEFLALAFICLTDYADLTTLILDDFQWIDSFSWKIFQVLGKKAQKLLLICAARSHDKQALRRLSTAASGQNQLQSKMIEISLGPFDFTEIRQLTSKVLGHDELAIPDTVCTDIFQRTGGLPVYVIQVLENIKRKKTLELDENGILQWTPEGLKEKRALASNKTGVVMEETFLSRFDVLDVRVRKILQTCAVLGLSFSLSDVTQVHPEMDAIDIESALESAADEMILVEHIDEDDDTMSLRTESTGEDSNDNTFGRSDSITGHSKSQSDRFFQFSHAMWRQNVLTTMLKERKIELHRLIAEAMEKDEVLVLEQSDISRLLTLFDHWKSCGDFCKTAPLALAVGARLEEWDLCAQSLELYEDALEMSFDTVQRVDGDADNSEWVSVAAQPLVLDYILRLHIRIGLCHQNLGEEHDSISMFEDAYNIIKTSSKMGSSASLMMPIISSLCVLKLDQIAFDTRTKLEQEKLVEKFVKEAIENGAPVHIGRSLAMEAAHYAKLGNLGRAFRSFKQLKSMYDVEANSFDMLAEYGRDFALECYCDSVQWLYLEEKEEEAEKQADMIIRDLLELLAPVDADIAMYAVLPLVQVLRLVGRARDAEDLLKKYIIEPYQENGSLADYWEPLFSPLAHLLELIVMEENEEEDPRVLEDLEEFAMDESNYEFSLELERKGHTIMGEICWRLLMYKDEDDTARDILEEKARDMLSPVATYPHPEIFLRRTAEALLEAL